MNTHKSITALAITAVGAITLAAVLFWYPRSAPAAPTIEWSPASLDITVSAGTSAPPASATLTLSEDVSDQVEVRVVPALVPYISVSPTSFSGL